MYEKIILNLVLDFVKETIKNPAHAEQFKQVLLDIRDAITLLYADRDTIDRTLPSGVISGK
jgi:hypothetical protein